MTRTRLEVWRRLSLTAVALLIFPVRVESVLSKEAASSPAWICEHLVMKRVEGLLTLQGHRDTMVAATGVVQFVARRRACYGCCCQQDMRRVWRAAATSEELAPRRSANSLIPAGSVVTFSFRKFTVRRWHCYFDSKSRISPMSREMALVAYRNLLRSARIAFQGTPMDSSLPNPVPG